MFWNIYGKRVLRSFRDRDSLIWTWIFPILLATMFFATFGSLDTMGMLDRFPLGVVNDEAYRLDAAFRSALESVSGEDGLFELIVIEDADAADAMLENGGVEGYILAGEIPVLVIAGDGINQTIAKGFLDRYIQTGSSVLMILANDPAAAANLPAMLSQVDYTREISLSKNPPSNRLNYFYALLAMVCMYGGFQGLASVTYLQANLSALGARRTVAPAVRWRMIVYDLLGGITVHVIFLFTVVAYITFVLGTSFGSQFGVVLLTCFACSMLGVAFGAMVSAVSRLKEQVKIAILITVSMVCSFLSGLMTSGINYTIAEKAPFIAFINPAARITDAFYCLYYYDNYERYLVNIGIIAGMAAAMFLTTAVFLRRQRYESI